MFLHTTRLNLISENEFGNSKFMLLGVPFDSTETNIPGQRLAPGEIRKAFLERGLETKDIYDSGDLNAIPGNAKKTLDILEETIKDALELNKNIIPVILGGEHLISLGSFKALKKEYKDLQFISFDAHYDLKDNYMGEKLSHSTVTRRIYELNKDVTVIGARAKDKEEEEFSKNINKIFKNINPNKPVYLSIDLDVINTREMPGVGDPEPNGLKLEELKNMIRKLPKNIVGIDIVEFNPLIEKVTSRITASEVLNTIFEVFSP